LYHHLFSHPQHEQSLRNVASCWPRFAAFISDSKQKMEKDHKTTSLVSAGVSVDEQALAQLQQDKAHHAPNGTFRNPWSTFGRFVPPSSSLSYRTKAVNWWCAVARNPKDFLKFVSGNGESFPDAELLRKVKASLAALLAGWRLMID
jgi:hypothetical protein